MVFLAAVVGYGIGSLPTAGAIARRAGIDLRDDGSGNPGTNNALRLGGPGLAAMVLVVEVSKGAMAALAGQALADEAGMVAAGVAAVTGNVHNVWYRLAGGKGLAISAGVLIATSPLLAIIGVAVIAVVAAITRSSGTAALFALATIILSSASAVFLDADWPGVSPEAALTLAIGIALVVSRKHWRDSSLNRRSRRRSPTPESPDRH